MPIIKSISGIRGTLGDVSGDNLTASDVAKFTAAFVFLLKEKGLEGVIVLGRDARPSGKNFRDIIVNVLLHHNVKVIDLGLATTPTVEMAVSEEKAGGGIIISASHNPIEWNALKFLNEQGEFLSQEDGQRLLALADSLDLDDYQFSKVSENEANLKLESKYNNFHIEKVLQLPLVNLELIKKAQLKVVVDGINSVGGVVIPELLKRLGVSEVIELNCSPDGQFAHNPEPLGANLEALSRQVIDSQADLGLAVDPDVDRLAFVSEDGVMFGEEYTLVAVADYVLRNYCPCYYQKISVSNLSSSRALRDITEKRGGSYYATAVGELNVVNKMKETGAVIGGEGNGGVILPELHYGRDALVGTALFLTALAESGQSMSKFRKNFPNYFMIKDKLELNDSVNMSALLEHVRLTLVQDKPAEIEVSQIDGLKLDYPKYWLHLRASNTEPIMRLYGEAADKAFLEAKIKEIKSIILAYIK